MAVRRQSNIIALTTGDPFSEFYFTLSSCELLGSSWSGNVQRLKILMLASEAAPFAKAGGLADVCGSLPKALAALGHDVRVIIPAYQPIEEAYRARRDGVHAHHLALQVPMGTGLIPAGVLHATLPGSDVPIYFIAEQHRFGNRPFYYGYGDDAERFAFFSRAALDFAIAALGWRPDVVHAHDWHTAPAITWLATAGQHDDRYARLPTLFTIHNLMHQGTSPWNIFRHLGLITHGLREERHGEVNFMARGIFHATMINTVSPTYSREILGWEGGCGLDGLLRHRHLDVHGILNGLDYEVWNPATDRYLAACFDSGSLERRLVNKRACRLASDCRNEMFRWWRWLPGSTAKRAWTSPATFCTC